MPKIYRLSKTEREVLWKKYINEGINFEQASEKINKINNHLCILAEGLKQGNKTPEEIDSIFREEFIKLCND